jgi:hypothetical protein
VGELPTKYNTPEIGGRNRDMKWDKPEEKQDLSPYRVVPCVPELPAEKPMFNIQREQLPTPANKHEIGTIQVSAHEPIYGIQRGELSTPANDHELDVSPEAVDS